MKIVSADNLKSQSIDMLKTVGDVHTPQNPDELKTQLNDADVLIVRSATKVTSDLIQNANSLKLVLRAGVGLDNVDMDACAQKGIKVKNTPGASTNAVSELAICMMLGICRKVGIMHQKLKDGVWAKKEGMGTEIFGKTLGIIGLGRIGSSVAKKAQALGMQIIYYDHSQKDVPYKFVDSIDSLLEQSDIISLHASAQKGAPPLLGASQFSKLKKGSYLINLARGSLVDEDALVEALNDGTLAGAALDVYPAEPYNGSLLRLDNVLLTPHIGASTSEAQLKIAQELVAHIKAI